MKEHTLEKVVPKCGIRAALVLTGSILIMIAVGQSFTTGNFSPYYISYIKNRTEHTEISSVDILWNSAVAGMTDWSGYLLSGVIERAVGPRITTLLFATLFSGSIAATFFTVQVSFIAVLLTLSLVNAIALSGMYGVALQTAVKWFPERSSFVSGVILSGIGAGALAMNQVITRFVNPDNVSPDLETDDGDRYFTDPDLLDRVPYCFVLLGGVCMTFTFIGSLTMATPPTQHDPDPDPEVSDADEATDIELPTMGKSDVSTSADNLVESTEKESNVCSEKQAEPTQESTNRVQDGDGIKTTLMVILKTRCFWILFFHIMLSMWAFQGIVELYKAYGQTFISDDHFLALIGTLAAVFNSAGRPVWGLIMDRFGYKVTVRCISAGLGALFATLFLTEKMPKWGLMIWICLLFFTYTGNWSVCPAAMAKLFGAGNISLAYGLMMPCEGIGNILVPVTGTTLKNTIGWHGMFFLSAAVATLPFFFTFAFNGVDSEGKRI